MFERLSCPPAALALSSDRGEEVYSLNGRDTLETGDICLTFTHGEGLTLSISAFTTGLSFLRLRWTWQEPVSGLVLGDELERSYGKLGWTCMQPWKAHPWYLLLRKEEETACYGVRVRPSAFAFWQVDPVGLTLLLDLRCAGSPLLLKGKCLTLCTICSKIYRGPSSFEAARDFMGELCSDPLPLPHPVYGSNNWYYAYGNSSREDLLRDTDYLMELCEGFENPPYMVIDDGWQLCHREDYNGGPWLGGPLYGSMASLAEEIKRKGARPGLWMRPLLDDSPHLPEGLRLPHTKALDPSHPAVLEHVREDIRRICSWGFQLIKHDFSTYDVFGRWGFEMKPFPAAPGWSFWDRSKTSAQVLVELYKVIYEEAQRHGVLILGCNTVGHLTAGLTHLQRTGDDTSGLLFERTVRFGVNTLAFRLPQHGRFFEVDADCAGITQDIPWEYNRQWCELLSYSGTPMFVSVKPGLLSPLQNQELREFLRIASAQSHHLRPLDWEYTSQPLCWGEEPDFVRGREASETTKAALAPSQQVETGALKETGLIRHFQWYEPTGLRSPREWVRWEDYSDKNLFI